jgi:hypothetical protein
MKLVSFSESCNLSETECNDPIHIFTQFFLPTNIQRLREIAFCLKQHVENEQIHKIHLLNETIYTDEELGTASDKIIQTNINKRLTFQDVFTYIRDENINGYFVLLNADMFFHPLSLVNLRKTSLHQNKEMMALLRYEYNHQNPYKLKLFGPRYDSQDTWIFHSNTLFGADCDKVFNFPFGKPGCDNKIIYLMHVLGFKVINDPFAICTFHVHTSNLRNYTIKDTIAQPWGMSVPPNIKLSHFSPALGIPSLTNLCEQRLQFNDNTVLYNYISAKIEKDTHFIIPRISGIENNVAVYCKMNTVDNPQPTLTAGIKKLLYAMKNNAGIALHNPANIQHYSQRYLQAFEYCDMFAGWDLQGNYIHHIFQTHEYIKQQFESKTIFWALAFDIFHYIYSNPWTQALRGKRILLVSPFEDSLREKIDVREQIYGIDLFPDCTFTFLKPPQTQASMPSRDFCEELIDFEKAIDDRLSDFDVALLSCGGYANPIGSYIYEKGKSAIYVGGVLQMYFGILGSRWLIERPDIVKLFANSHWSRPKDTERPAGCNKVEGGCYW